MSLGVKGLTEELGSVVAGYFYIVFKVYRHLLSFLVSVLTIYL